MKFYSVRFYDREVILQIDIQIGYLVLALQQRAWLLGLLQALQPWESVH